MLKTMEHSLLLRKDTLGVAHADVQSLGNALTHEYNAIAMQVLRADDMFDAVHSLLKKAYVMTEPDTFFVDTTLRLRLRAITLNNLGCLYKRRGKLASALQYLEKALKIEMTTPGCDNPAGTHLNVCAVLSLQGRHQYALEHAQLALDITLRSEAEAEHLGEEAEMEEARDEAAEHQAEEDTTEGTSIPTDREDVPGEQGHGVSGAEEKQLLTAHLDDGTDKASMLPVAYHNLAVEYEHLGQHEEAMESYLQAADVARQRLGLNDPLTTAMQDALDAAVRTSKDVSRKAPAATDNKKQVRAMSIPWMKNKNDTPRTRHKEPRHTAPHSAQAFHAQGGEPPEGRIGDVYQVPFADRKRRSKGRRPHPTMDDVLGTLPPIDGTVDAVSFRTPRLPDNSTAGPMGRQRAAWERLPWNHVQVDTFADEDTETFMPPPPSQRGTLADIYGAPGNRKTDVPKPPPRLPPGVLYRPKRTQMSAQS